jgi:hypothetical protein
MAPAHEPAELVVEADVGATAMMLEHRAVTSNCFSFIEGSLPSRGLTGRYLGDWVTVAHRSTVLLRISDVTSGSTPIRSGRLLMAARRHSRLRRVTTGGGAGAGGGVDPADEAWDA